MGGQKSTWRGWQRDTPEERLGRLHDDFRAVSKQFDRSWWQRITGKQVCVYGLTAGFLAIGAVYLYAEFKTHKWPLMTTLKHVAAAPNCSAARAVGLAPARRGQPGYYFRHDRDQDGIACEPWSRY